MWLVGRKLLASLATAAVYILWSVLWPAPSAIAAVCCGSHAAIPSVITGYESARVAVTVSRNTLIGNAPVEGRAVFRQPDNRPERWTVGLSGSWAFADRWQLGAGLPIGIGASIGDVQTTLAWEAIPRPDLLSVSPKVLVFTQLVAPTGRSTYEVDTIEETQITGRGFFQTAIGALAVSTYRRWDFFGISKASVGWTRTFAAQANGSISERTVNPGWEGSLTWGLGYSLGPEWRIGGSLSTLMNEGYRVRFSDGRSQTLSSSLWWPLELQLAWFYDMDGVVSLSYVDDTFMGPARNAALTRSLSMQFAYRWGAN